MWSENHQYENTNAENLLPSWCWLISNVKSCMNTIHLTTRIRFTYAGILCTRQPGDGGQQKPSRLWQTKKKNNLYLQRLSERLTFSLSTFWDRLPACLVCFGIWANCMASDRLGAHTLHLPHTSLFTFWQSCTTRPWGNVILHHNMAPFVPLSDV